MIRKEQEFDMKHLTVTTAAAAALSAAVLGLAAPAVAAPSSGSGNAQHTITELEAMGNRVVINRLTGVPLSEAEIVAVRPGAEIREWVTSDGGSRRGGDHSREDRVLRTVGRILYVDVR